MMVQQRIVNRHESPQEMLDRVIKALFSAELKFGTDVQEISEMSWQFAEYMVEGYVMPGTPTITNAGRNIDRTLSSCVVIPVDLNDKPSAASVIKSYYKQNMGSGFDFTQYEDPVELLTWINNLSAQETLIGDYDRYIGNMGNLHISHPKIEAFVDAKKEDGVIQHFNISVDLSDEFMNAVQNDSKFTLSDGQIIEAKVLFRKIAENAWLTGDPGILFLERMNRDNPLSEISSYCSTPPCGEMGLSEGETCQFAYINLARFTRDGKIDYEKLEEVTTLTARILDNAIEASLEHYPTIASRDINSQKRKIGIGVCGLAEMLIVCHTPYGSAEGRELARDVLSYINYVSKVESVKLAEERGPCLAMLDKGNNAYYTERFLERKYGFSTRTVTSDQWRQLSDYIFRTGSLRNILTTALPPSGRTSIILGTTSSIEPLFTIFNEHGDIRSAVKDFINEEIPSPIPVLKQAQQVGTFQHIQDLSHEVRHSLKTAKELSYVDHVSMVAAVAGIHGVVDEAASKTVNLPSNASVDDIESIFILAYNLGLKNIAVYRDQSKAYQPEKL